MRYAELLQLYFERSTAIQNYWTVYLGVIGGLLAVSALRTRPDVIAGVLVTALYCAFAYKNCSAIGEVTANREAVLSAIHDYPGVDAEYVRHRVEPTLTPPAYPGVRNFHVACDVGVIATLWAMQWRRAREARRTA